MTVVDVTVIVVRRPLGERLAYVVSGALVAIATVAIAYAVAGF